MAADPQDVQIAASWFVDHRTWLHRRAVKAVGADYADDAVQTLFFSVVRRGQLTEIDDPEKFLTRVQSMVFAKHLGRRVRMEVPVEQPVPELTDPTPVGERIERIEDIRLVRRCLPLLKGRHRAVLELQVAGLSRKEIAEELGVSAHAVTQLTRRALDALNHKLNQNGYIRGLIPIPMVYWLREKARTASELLSRHTRSIEAIMPMAVVVVGSMLPLGATPGSGIPDRDLAKAPELSSVVESGSAPAVPAPAETGHGNVATAEIDHRQRSVSLEDGNTNVWVDEWDDEEQEPPLDEQIMNFISDPGRAFPSCPETVPCPWADV